MTESMTTTSATEERLRCPVGGKTERPCWREATELVDLWEEGRRYCPEHARFLHLSEEVEELLDALDEMGAWIATWDDPEEDEGPLKRFAFKMREKAISELWQTVVKAEAAELVAIQGPDAAPLSFEQAARHEEARLRTDAFIDAHVILEDLRIVPEEAFGSGSRWHLAAALKAAADATSAEHARYRREIGRG